MYILLLIPCLLTLHCVDLIVIHGLLNFNCVHLILLHGLLKFHTKKTISNDQELIQSDPISCPQNQKGKIQIYKLTAVYERHAR